MDHGSIFCAVSVPIAPVYCHIEFHLGLSTFSTFDVTLCLTIFSCCCTYYVDANMRCILAVQWVLHT